MQNVSDISIDHMFALSVPAIGYDGKKYDKTIPKM